MSSKTTKKITVEKRGTFNDDSFFKDSWSEWDQAMKDAVDRWDKQTGDTKKTSITDSTPASETKTVYRQMRTSNVTSDESQAVSCTEEDGKYKMVMDVKDFSPEDISVKVVDDTIVVEGKIEKTEGNSTTSQKFVRRFLLPSGVNMNAIGSALSKDGVLTINVPKVVALPSSSSKSEKSIPVRRDENTITSRVMGSNYGRPKFIQVTGGTPAGRRTNEDSGPFNPTGGSNVTVYETSSRPNARMTETITLSVPDRRKDHTISTKTDNSDNWTTFNTMVKNSQKEMEDMMKTHTLSSNTHEPSTAVTMLSSPVGAVTTKDITRSGNTVTERQEKKWDDNPAPGMHRSNRALQENSDIKDDQGHVIGNKLKMEKESKAEGTREEIMPDGTKCKIFTKTYETKNSYRSNLR